MAVLILQMTTYTQRIQKRLVAILLGLVRDFPRSGVGGGQIGSQGWANVPRIALTLAIGHLPDRTHPGYGV